MTKRVQHDYIVLLYIWTRRFSFPASQPGPAGLNRCTGSGDNSARSERSRPSPISLIVAPCSSRAWLAREEEGDEPIGRCLYQVRRERVRLKKALASQASSVDDGAAVVACCCCCLRVVITSLQYCAVLDWLHVASRRYVSASLLASLLEFHHSLPACKRLCHLVHSCYFLLTLFS